MIPSDVVILIYKKIDIYIPFIHLLLKFIFYLIQTIMYNFTSISRTLSSGSESRFFKSFETLEEAAKYIQNEWYDQFCEAFEFPGDWDEEDKGCSFPKKEEFTYESLKQKFTNKYSKRRVVLINAYSQYAALIPNEVLLEIY
jgi:hypothetical protein